MEAIERANLITVGPGSLYTSLITNLLVEGIPAALANARGLRVFICNLMTQANESLGLTASEHIERIYEHTRAPIFDCALINTTRFPKRRWRAIRLKAPRRSPPTSSGSRRSAFAASPATSPAKAASSVTRPAWSLVRSSPSAALPFPPSPEYFLFPADSLLSYSESSRGPLPAHSRRTLSCARLTFRLERAFAFLHSRFPLVPRHKESPACTR